MFEHVYVFLRADGLRKVGHTGDIHRRRKELVAATGLEHQIERVWRLTEKAHAIEGYVHYSLRSLKVRGCGSLEVYDVPLERLAEEIERGIEWVAKLGIRLSEGAHTGAEMVCRTGGSTPCKTNTQSLRRPAKTHYTKPTPNTRTTMTRAIGTRKTGTTSIVT